jgi:hypothetical protein
MNSDELLDKCRSRGADRLLLLLGDKAARFIADIFDARGDNGAAVDAR